LGDAVLGWRGWHVCAISLIKHVGSKNKHIKAAAAGASQQGCQSLVRLCLSACNPAVQQPTDIALGRTTLLAILPQPFSATHAHSSAAYLGAAASIKLSAAWYVAILSILT
jgi:hypothetical protein